MRIIIMLTILPTLCFGMDRFSASSMIETGNNDRVVGKAGEIEPLPDSAPCSGIWVTRSVK